MLQDLSEAAKVEKIQNRLLLLMLTYQRRRFFSAVAGTCSKRGRQLFHTSRPTSAAGLPKDLDIFAGSDFSTKLMVDGYSDNVFSVNGVLVPGPIFLLPNAIFSWNVNRVEDISADNLSLAYTISPSISILILGCGERIKMIHPDLRDFFRKKGIAIEALDTWNACATFNILNQEDRNVAAALIPFEKQQQQ